MSFNILSTLLSKVEGGYTTSQIVLEFPTKEAADQVYISLYTKSKLSEAAVVRILEKLYE